MKNKFWKVLLHKDSVLLMGIFGSLWVSVNMLADINTDFNKLHPHTGQVTDMQLVITRMKNKPLYKDTTRELRIALADEPKYFTISSNKTNFSDITTAINNGDTITVYTKDKVFGVFGFGNEQVIAHLVKHPTKQVLVNFTEKQQYYNSFAWLPILGTIGFLIWYIIRVRKRLWWELGGYEKHLEVRTTERL
jgi:hypothetical protein